MTPEEQTNKHKQVISMLELLIATTRSRMILRTANVEDKNNAQKELYLLQSILNQYVSNITAPYKCKLCGNFVQETKAKSCSICRSELRRNLYEIFESTKKIKQSELAKKLGVSRQRISVIYHEWKNKK